MNSNFDIKGPITEETYIAFEEFSKTLKNGQKITVSIYSPGGLVDPGMAIYTSLKNLKISLGISITTKSLGLVGSIAETIYQAGDIRVTHSTDRFLIHPPTVGVNGNSRDLGDYTALLDNVEQQMFEIHRAHAKSYITDEEIRAQIQNETSISARDYYEMGYATELVDFAATGYCKDINLFNMNAKNGRKMENNQEGVLASISKGLDSLVALFTPKEQETKTDGEQHVQEEQESQEQPKASIEVQDVTGVILTFPMLAQGDTPKEGDEVTSSNGEKDGRYIIDKATIYEVKGGSLSRVIKVDQAIAMVEENEQLKASLAEKAAKQEEFVKEAKALAGQIELLKTSQASMPKAENVVEVKNENKEHIKLNVIKF